MIEQSSGKIDTVVTAQLVTLGSLDRVECDQHVEELRDAWLQSQSLAHISAEVRIRLGLANLLTKEMVVLEAVAIVDQTNADVRDEPVAGVAVVPNDLPSICQICL